MGEARDAGEAVDVEGVVADAHLRPVARAAAPRWQQQAGGAASARETTTYLHTLPKTEPPAAMMGV